MLIILFKRHFLWIALLLSGLVGLTLGNLVSTIIGIINTPQQAIVSTLPKVTPKALPQATLASYQTIIDHNIFNSTNRNKTTNTLTTSYKSTNVSSRWTLVGTLSGGESPLATLKDSSGITTYQLNDELPDGATLSVVERNRVELRYRSGEIQTLETIKTRGGAATPSARGRTTKGLEVNALGENRWQIPALTAQNARSNLGKLLRQARAVPYIEGDQTTGFQIKRIKVGSLFAQIGLRRGDILRKVNGLELNSPEKALQIFGQLRQAKQINIDLERRGKALTFAYEIR